MASPRLQRTAARARSASRVLRTALRAPSPTDGHPAFSPRPAVGSLFAPPVAFWGYWGPVGDPLKKPGCPSLCEAGKRGFAPTELLTDLVRKRPWLVVQDSPAPPPGPRPGPGASAPTFAAPRRPLRFASGSSTRPVKAAPPPALRGQHD